MFLTHPRPLNVYQGGIWKRLVNGNLNPLISKTWEKKLSAGESKKDTFEELMIKNQLGGLATLRNLRNMEEAGIVDPLRVIRLSLIHAVSVAGLLLTSEYVVVDEKENDVEILRNIFTKKD